MFGFFKKTSKKSKLEKQYNRLMEESFHLSKTDRRAADAKVAEAEEVLNELKKFEN